MAFEVVRSRAFTRDLDRIFDRLVESYQGFGQSFEEALARAADRVRAIETAVDGLAHAPFQGTLRAELRPGLRQVTKDRTIFYFEVDEAAGQVRVLAVFFGGQDHLARMLRRLGRDQ
jgi:plasmid stabilization system protein ParE